MILSNKEKSLHKCRKALFEIAKVTYYEEQKKNEKGKQEDDVACRIFGTLQKHKYKGAWLTGLICAPYVIIMCAGGCSVRQWFILSQIRSLKL